MRTMIQNRNTPYGDVVFAAPRQVWLASLGAAVITRDWAQTEAGNVFRTLVKQGTAVESKAIRMVGDGLDVSFNRANAVWKQARTTVKQAAETAVTLVQNNIPKSLPKVALPEMLRTSSSAKTQRAAKKAVAKTKRVLKTRATKTVKRAKRNVRAATKR